MYSFILYVALVTIKTGPEFNVLIDDLQTREISGFATLEDCNRARQTMMEGWAPFNTQLTIRREIKNKTYPCFRVRKY